MTELAQIPNILRRQLDQMQWVEPRKVLVNLRQVELRLPSDMDQRTRTLRTRDLRKWHEARHAVLFAFGVAEKVIKTPIWVSKSQERDFDFVMKWRVNDGDCFSFGQLKELPPDDVNGDVTLEDIFDKLEKYSGSDDLCVVIALNRRTRIQFQPWSRPSRPRIRQLWYMGCESPDQARWFVYGSVLSSNPRKYEFSYPASEQDVA